MHVARAPTELTSLQTESNQPTVEACYRVPIDADIIPRELTAIDVNKDSGGSFDCSIQKERVIVRCVLRNNHIILSGVIDEIPKPILLNLPKMLICDCSALHLL